MSMIRTVSYKVCINGDGSIYNESIEYGAETDSMPLAQSQLDDAGARVDQLRQAILAKRKQWDGPVPPMTQAEAPKEQPKQAAPSQPGLATEKQVNYIAELAAKTPNRLKLVTSYLTKNNLLTLQGLNQKQVDELIMRLKNEV